MLKLTCLVCLFAIPPVVVGLNVAGKGQQNGPVSFGDRSEGYVSLDAGSTLSQSCNLSPPYSCGEITGGVMSSLFMAKGSTLVQDPESKIICGNYTVITLDTGCQLSLAHQAQLRPNIDFGGGRIELYCSSAWNLGEASYVNLDRQSKMLVKANLQIGKFVFVKMEPGSTLDIGNSLEMQDLVWLFLNKNSKLQINPTSGGAATISSSNDFTMTTVTLDNSSYVEVNGTFTVGNGREVKMTVGTSGSLLITTKGEFLVESSTFEIGASSFWIINGKFSIDKSSTYSSGIQSNLTVDGTFKTDGGNLVVAPFSSFSILGACFNQGNLTTNEFARLVIGPIGKENQGQIIAQSGATLFLGRLSTVEVMGYLISQGSIFIVGERATAYIAAAAQVQQQSGSLIQLDSGAALNVTGSGQIQAEAGKLLLQSQAHVNVSGQLKLSGNSNIVVQERAEVIFSLSTKFQQAGNMLVCQGSSVVFNGNGEILGGKLNVLQQAVANLQGGINLFHGANVTVGECSTLEIPSSTIVNVNPMVQFLIGERSLVKFGPNLFCNLMINFSVEGFKVETLNSNTYGISCFSIG